LIYLQLARESHAVIPQPPSSACPVSGPCEWTSAEHKQIPTPTQIFQDGVPRLFRKGRPVRQNQQAHVSLEQTWKLRCRSQLRSWQQVFELLAGWGSRVGACEFRVAEQHTA
jgi:hypothetical protein